MLLTLNVDCIRHTLLFLDANDLLVVGQACLPLNRLSNEPSLWLDLLRRRLGRDVVMEDPKAVYSRSLRVGYPHLISSFSGEDIPLHEKLATRNDIMRIASCSDCVACVTLEYDCIIDTFASCREIGRAEDVRIEQCLKGEDLTITVATLYQQRVTLYELDEELHVIHSTTLDCEPIRLLIGFYKDHGYCILLATFNDTVISATMDSIRTIATGIRNGYLVSHDRHPPRLSWSPDVDKYICSDGDVYFLLGTTLYIGSNNGHNSSLVEEIQAPQSSWMGNSLPLTEPLPVEPACYWYRCTVDVVDAWYDGCDVVVLTVDRKVYTLYNDTPPEVRRGEDVPLAVDVLWARSDPSGGTNYISALP
jgi:hypothetical protein